MSEKCHGHKQAVLVYKSPVRILAGGKTPGTPIPLATTVLALGVDLRSPIEGLGTLDSKIIRFDWPDMSCPAIDREGWQKIVKALVRLRRPIYVSCGAGHGRTGTALAILGSLLGQIPKKSDPVQWVRDHYCPNAVETETQIAYVQKITERTVTAKASMGSWQGSTTYTGHGQSTQSYTANSVFCKGKGNTCTVRVEKNSKDQLCKDCRQKAETKAWNAGDGGASRIPGTGSALDDVQDLGGKTPPMRERIKDKFFPDQGK